MAFNDYDVEFTLTVWRGDGTPRCQLPVYDPDASRLDWLPGHNQ
jgi:hypothetical protein